MRIYTFKDISGKKFSRLEAIKFIKREKGKTYWLFKCDCGREIIKRMDSVICGSVMSCGCLNNEKRNTPKKHGLTHHRLHHIWLGMKRRCFNKNFNGYKNYGGRGITICNEWKTNFISFYNWSIENGYNDNLSIDRINVNGNYEPSNCRWATRLEQCNNTRARVSKYFNGERVDVKRLAESNGLNSNALLRRIKRGWSINESLTIPLGQRRSKNNDC